MSAVPLVSSSTQVYIPTPKMLQRLRNPIRGTDSGSSIRARRQWMAAFTHLKHTTAGRLALPCLSFLFLSLCGCAGTWYEITSRNFEMKNLYTSPDPLVVLRDSTDGAKRGHALSKLREPLQNGGKAEEQELYVKILTKS